MLRLSCKLINYQEITPQSQLYHGLIFLYQFEVIPKDKTDQPNEKENIKQYGIIVDITGSRITTWGFKNRREDLEKVLYLFARKKLEEILNKFPEKTEERIKLHTRNSQGKCPYDPMKIEFPPKTPFLLELSRRIGF